jgi:hypothetical protein
MFVAGRAAQPTGIQVTWEMATVSKTVPDVVLLNTSEWAEMFTFQFL